MVDNDPTKDWITENEKPETDENEKYELFYIKYFKPRTTKGWEPDSASRDAPEGFTKWLKSRNRTIK
jgi:hypothetical protein